MNAIIRRGISLKKTARLLVLILIAVIAIGYNLKLNAETRENLIDTYRELDAADFALQEIAPESNRLQALASEIYCEPQLEAALTYLMEMRDKKVKFVVESLKYPSIKVLEHSDNSATMLVQAEVAGSFFHVNDPEEKIRTVRKKTLYQVQMAKIGEKWKIKQIDFLE